MNKISFESLQFRGVKTETLEQMNDSFLSDIYDQSKSIINYLIQSNKVNLETEINEMQNSIQNVIAFTGRRGTGKTSAMLSMANHLSSGKSDFIETFYVLPYIDVSVLEESEDVFLIILSKMLDLINDSIPACNYRYIADINEKINSIKERICMVYDHYLKHKRKGFT